MEALPETPPQISHDLDGNAHKASPKIKVNFMYECVKILKKKYIGSLFNSYAQGGWNTLFK